MLCHHPGTHLLGSASRQATQGNTGTTFFNPNARFSVHPCLRRGGPRRDLDEPLGLEGRPLPSLPRPLAPWTRVASGFCSLLYSFVSDLLLGAGVSPRCRGQGKRRSSRYATSRHLLRQRGPTVAARPPRPRAGTA